VIWLNSAISEADELRKPQLITRIVEQQELIEAARAQQQIPASNMPEITSALLLKKLLMTNHVKGTR